jgi:hypothetical protein
LLFRNRPELAPELLREALGVELPAYCEVRVESANLTDIVPAEYRADLVVLLVDGKPVFAIAVEVQLARDDRKRFTWPVYVAGLRARFECQVAVLPRLTKFKPNGCATASPRVSLKAKPPPCWPFWKRAGSPPRRLNASESSPRPISRRSITGCAAR